MTIVGKIFTFFLRKIGNMNQNKEKQKQKPTRHDTTLLSLINKKQEYRPRAVSILTRVATKPLLAFSRFSQCATTDRPRAAFLNKTCLRGHA